MISFLFSPFHSLGIRSSGIRCMPYHNNFSYYIVIYRLFFINSLSYPSFGTLCILDITQNINILLPTSAPQLIFLTVPCLHVRNKFYFLEAGRLKFILLLCMLYLPALSGQISLSTYTFGWKCLCLQYPEAILCTKSYYAFSILSSRTEIPY